MKSVLISFLMFAIIGGAMYIGVFDVISSVYANIFGFVCLILALVFAFYQLGNPFKTISDTSKKQEHDDDKV